MPADVTIRDDRLRDTSAVTAGAVFGLYPASDFRLADGLCNDCGTIAQALWYFQREVIAVAKPGRPVASFATGVSVADDLVTWLAGRDPAAVVEYPPLVWVAAPDAVHGARLSADTATLEWAGESLRASLVPKVALNRSFFDATSAEFFRRRTIKVRGWIDVGAVAIRTLWPEDFRIDRSRRNR